MPTGKAPTSRREPSGDAPSRRCRSRSSVRTAVWTLAALLIGACAPHRESTMARVRREGTIRVGYASHAPYSFQQADDSASGLDPALAREVLLHQLHLRRIDWVRLPFDSLVPALTDGRIDLATGGLFVTPGRAARVSFSHPLYCVAAALVVPRGNPNALHAYTDVVGHQSLRLAVLRDADELSLAEHAGVEETQLLIMPDLQTGVTALQYGEASAFAVTVPAAARVAAADDDVAIATPFHAPTVNGKPVRWCAAFGMRRSDTDLRLVVDSALATFVGSPAHVRMAAAFGVDSTELPVSAPRSGGARN